MNIADLKNVYDKYHDQLKPEVPKTDWRDDLAGVMMFPRELQQYPKKEVEGLIKRLANESGIPIDDMRAIFNYKLAEKGVLL